MILLLYYGMSSFQQLVEIVKKLRGPNGCPWDKAQTHKSLTAYAIEEAHELEQAIENNDIENMKEELGDLLFQSILHSEIARQNNDFDINDVINHLNHKMISRHPHVFANTIANTPDEVLKNWEEIKAQEKQTELFDIPLSFPALLRAHKIGKKSQKMNFDWMKPQEVLLKVKEELTELELAIEKNDLENTEEELGDLLFTISQLARHLKLDAEKSLRKANLKFIKRFENMLKLNSEFKDLVASEKEKLWNQVKALKDK
jgi:tetrapyrrole methylase family protein / MazG family protein